MHDLLVHLGFFTDGAFPHVGGFWSTPIGIFITCLLTIRHFLKSRADSGIRSLWHIVMAFVWFVAFCGGLTPNYDPHHIVQTVLGLLCIETLIDVYHWWKEKQHGTSKSS